MIFVFGITANFMHEGCDQESSNWKNISLIFDWYLVARSTQQEVKLVKVGQLSYSSKTVKFINMIILLLVYKNRVWLVNTSKFYIWDGITTIKCIFWKANDSIVKKMLSNTSSVSLWNRPCYKKMLNYDNVKVDFLWL